MTSSDAQRARVFGSVADAYDRWRPGYPQRAIDWLVPPGAARVADVGAGTGKLTGSLLGRGLDVVAVEPDPDMLAVLRARYPAAEATLAGAENLPLSDASVDAVLVGQAWHWFDQEQALAQARRVTRPGGWLGLIGNVPFPRTPWQLELAQLDPDPAHRTFVDPTEDWAHAGLAGLAVETLKVTWREELSAAGLRARMATYSVYAVMPDDERTQSLDDAAAVLAREADRLGASVVPFDHITFCTRVRL
jgi:SAM-dependent methyltransferase